MISLIFLFLGLLLIFIEFYLPGAIMGIAGGIMLFISIILFATNSQSLIETILYIGFVGMILIALVKFALYRIRTSAKDHSIYSDAHQSGFQACSFDATLIGREGIVVTDLKPGGHVLVDGKRVQAISQNNYLVKGTAILVIGGQEDSLIVKKNEKKE